MLNASAFIQTFQGFITRGVSNVFLCNKDGALLCAANNIDSIKPTAAIMSTIWCDYEANLPLEHEEEDEDLQTVIIQGGEGTLVATQISSLCLVVEGEGPTGRLMEVLEKLHSLLANSLENALKEADINEEIKE